MKKLEKWIAHELACCRNSRWWSTKERYGKALCLIEELAREVERSHCGDEPFEAEHLITGAMERAGIDLGDRIPVPVLLDAHQGKVHKDSEKVRAGKSARTVREKRLEGVGFEEPTETQKAGGDFGRG